MYTYRWVSLLVWPYFIEGVVRATSDRGRQRAAGRAGDGAHPALFAACALHVRLRLRKANS
jgi:uncharacterized membrane protein